MGKSSEGDRVDRSGRADGAPVLAGREGGGQIVSRPRGSALHAASRFLNRLSAISIFFVMGLMTYEVAQRAAGQNSLPGMTGLTELLLAFVVALSLPLAYREDKHVSTGIVADRLSERRRLILETAGLVVTVGFLAWLSYATIVRAWSATVMQEIRYGIIAIPAWPGRIALAVGVTVMTLEACRRLWGHVQQLRSSSPGIEQGRNAHA